MPRTSRARSKAATGRPECRSAAPYTGTKRCPNRLGMMRMRGNDGNFMPPLLECLGDNHAEGSDPTRFWVVVVAPGVYAHGREAPPRDAQHRKSRKSGLRRPGRSPSAATHRSFRRRLRLVEPLGTDSEWLKPGAGQALVM